MLVLNRLKLYLKNNYNYAMNYKAMFFYLMKKIDYKLSESQ